MMYNHRCHSRKCAEWTTCYFLLAHSLGCRLSFMLTMLWTIQLIFILNLNIVVQTEFLIRSIFNFISAAWRWRYRAAVVLLWRLSPLWLQWPAVPGGLQSSLDPRLQWWPAVPGDLQGSFEPWLQCWPAVWSCSLCVWQSSRPPWLPSAGYISMCFTKMTNTTIK